jgi:cytochrome P450
MTLLPFDELPLLSGGKGLLGHATEVEQERLAFIEKATRETSRMVRLRVPSVNVVFVNHPELLHEVMTVRAKDFEKSHLLRYSLYLLAGEGLFTAMFEPWKRNRRMMAPVFHPGSLGVFAEPMVECARRVTDEWRGSSEIDVLRETTRMTMAIAGRTLFNTDTLSDSDEVGHALTTALDWTAKNAPSTRAFIHIWVRFMAEAAADRSHAKSGSLLRNLQQKLNGPVLLFGKQGKDLHAAIATLDRHVKQILDARKASLGAGDHTDLLSRILSARDEEDGSALSEKQVRDEILTLSLPVTKPRRRRSRGASIC